MNGTVRAYSVSTASAAITALQSPLFEEIQSGFQVTLYKEKTGQTLQEKGQEMLKVLRNNPTITIKELSEQQHVSIKTVRNQLEKLKQTGRITRVGPDKGGHWQITGKTGGMK